MAEQPVGNFAIGLGNCKRIEPKSFKASSVALRGSEGRYRIPFNTVIGRNSWYGVNAVFVIEAYNGATKVNECIHRVSIASPLVLDFTGEARLATVRAASSRVRFDLDGTGVRRHVGWVDGARGLLALDRDGDGTIDSGVELFGDATPRGPGIAGARAANGYAALAAFDSLGRGYVDALDPVFARLRVWFDRNQDGVSQPDELATLAEVGVTRIDTTYEEAPQRRIEAGVGENDVRWRSRFYGPAACGPFGCASYDAYFVEATSLVQAAPRP
jgi:hypothetical protein